MNFNVPFVVYVNSSLYKLICTTRNGLSYLCRESCGILPFLFQIQSELFTYTSVK